MSETPHSHHKHDADMAVHDAQGNVKLKLEADDHLARLLAPDTEVAWYKTIVENVMELVRPEKLPPLEGITSKPVAVKDIWGLYGAKKSSGLVSMAIHAGLFALLWFVFTSPVVQKAIKKEIVLIAPVMEQPKPLKPKIVQGGGGSPGPSKPIMRVIPKVYQPLVQVQTPKLTVAPSLVAPPDAYSDMAVNGMTNSLNGVFGVGGGGGGLGTGIGSVTGSGRGPGSGGGSGGGAYKIGELDARPVPIYQPQPEYSDEARKAKFSGEVVVACVITATGTVDNCSVSKSVGMGLDEKALEAVRTWKFKPGTKAGKPVAVQASIAVTFRLL